MVRNMLSRSYLEIPAIAASFDSFGKNGTAVVNDGLCSTQFPMAKGSAAELGIFPSLPVDLGQQY